MRARPAPRGAWVAGVAAGAASCAAAIAVISAVDRLGDHGPLGLFVAMLIVLGTLLAAGRVGAPRRSRLRPLPWTGPAR